jgi:hypothetical protein
VQSFKLVSDQHQTINEFKTCGRMRCCLEDTHASISITLSCSLLKELRHAEVHQKRAKVVDATLAKQHNTSQVMSRTLTLAAGSQER